MVRIHLAPAASQAIFELALCIWVANVSGGAPACWLLVQAAERLLRLFSRGDINGGDHSTNRWDPFRWGTSGTPEQPPPLNRALALDRDPVHQPPSSVVIVDRVVLDCAVVPERQRVAFNPLAYEVIISTGHGRKASWIV